MIHWDKISFITMIMCTLVYLESIPHTVQLLDLNLLVQHICKWFTANTQCTLFDLKFAPKYRKSFCL